MGSEKENLKQWNSVTTEEAKPYEEQSIVFTNNDEKCNTTTMNSGDVLHTSIQGMNVTTLSDNKLQSDNSPKEAIPASGKMKQSTSDTDGSSDFILGVTAEAPDRINSSNIDSAGEFNHTQHNKHHIEQLLHNGNRVEEQTGQCTASEALQELQGFVHHPFDRGKDE